MKNKFLLTLLLLSISGMLSAQIGRVYPDGHGGCVFFPLGDISFADQVVYYDHGNPMPEEEDRDPSKALGIPDYNEEEDINFTSLGYGGELIVKFTDNVLYDIDGNDLYIFEIGGNEAFEVFISKNGKDWIDLGKFGGGRTEIDIAPYVSKSDVFRYVKIKDLKTDNGPWPGADIDAIGAIGSSVKLKISGNVLFNTGEATIKAPSVLRKIADKIKQSGGKVIIEGYTDNVGSAEDNMILSQKRASSVKSFLVDSCGIDSNLISTQAFGETNPVADNSTAEGRQKNRRVEIIIFPHYKNTNDVTGVWDTDFGEMHIYRYGDTVAGWYSEDCGEIFGTFIDPHTLELTWAENSSNQRCDKDLYGRHYIGKAIFKFNDDFTAFEGKWGYCDDEPTTAGWNGKRK